MSQANRIFSKLLTAALALGTAACLEGGEAEAAGGGRPSPSSDSSATRFWLPTGEVDNTSAPTIEIDAKGGVHSVYPAYAGGRAYYSYCPDECADPKKMKVVRFTTDESIHNIMIALGSDGRPQVLLSGGQKVFYASAKGDFTQQDAWSVAVILDHHGDREVTGEAFALDPQDRPRFIMHTYEAYLGVGQKPPQAFFVRCDAACLEAGSWNVAKVADQFWRGSTLRYDRNGVAKVASVVTVDRSQYSSGVAKAAYIECAADCDNEASWKGIAFSPAWESTVEAVRMPPAISMALTRKGAPRIVYIGINDYKRNLTYFECDADCAGDHWTASMLSELDKINAGVDLSLDANDHPRFVHTLSYNIALAHCEDEPCAAPDAKWDLTKVEYGGDMRPDEIFLYATCNVAAWFLHDPSLALTASGRAIVGYQARDISGGWQQPTDPKKPRCRAGTDMTWARMAVVK